MAFKFDPDQQYQLDAIAAVADALDGQPLVLPELSFDEARAFPVVANQLELTDEALLDNLRAVQRRNDLAEDDALRTIEEVVETMHGDVAWSFPNLSVEMETGTGKTYIYIRTAFELCRRYGLRKFIIVVPSIAIREGVLKTFEMTSQHFSALYENTPYRYYAYEARRLSQIRQFALSDSIEFMVMTLDSFNKSTNLIRRAADRLQGEKPLSLVQETRPVLVLDEPQNMESELSIASLAALTPSLALRYSATHRDSYNLVYRLTPVDAYNRGLVKQVEVAGVERDMDANRPFLNVDSIRATRRSCSAKLVVHVLRAGGGVREKKLTVRSGSSLEMQTDRPEYHGYDIDEINPGTQLVRFTNNVELAVGDTQGDNRLALFDSQIRYTLREHFLKQARLKDRGIKVLSLFFVDRVANYEGDDPVIKDLFDAAFDDLKTDFPDWSSLDAADVRGAYFAQKTRRGGRIELLDTRTAATDEDKAVFDLIMRDKERLLSFDEKIAFIFSHSALREGWDNPNVFQICTLNQSVSEVRKRQEIGRGIRLSVDQDGERVMEPSVNVLTVVANESYERYVERYQDEIEDDYGQGVATPRIRNARKRIEVSIRQDILEDRHFLELWEKIRRKSRYRVKVDTEALLTAVVPALDDLDIRPVRIRVGKGRIIPQDTGEFGAQAIAASRTLTSVDADATPAQAIETMVHLLEQSSPPLRLTRRTLYEVLRRSRKRDAALANPHEWASEAIRLIREHLSDQLVENISYELSGETYDLSQFVDPDEAWEDRLVETERSLYEAVEFDSEVERRFIQRLENDDRTLAYIKLPRWFTVSTPVGRYNPDWAIVRERRDEHGTVLGSECVVAETKATLKLEKLRADERRKILCGRRHFEAALGVRFEVATSLADLDLDD